jgi:hypothetical protein
METIDRLLSEVEIGPASTFGGMTLLPILGSKQDSSAPRYRTLDQALGAGEVRISEIGDGGHVPELQIENLGKRAVLLLDGEELVGAKQNRVLNVTVLSPAGKTIVIPVSCVEAGRWATAGRHFSSASHLMYSAGRAAKAAQVSRSASLGHGFRSDQSAVWDGIAAKMEVMAAPSPTSAMGDVYRQRSQGVDEYVRAFPAVDGQIGGVFAVGGKLIGIELFDHPATLRELLPKLVRSYALDAIEDSERRGQAHAVPTANDVTRFLQEIREAEAETHPGVGLGTDVRLSGPRIVGGALVHDDRVLHLSAFRTQDGTLSHDGTDADENRPLQGPAARLSRSRGRRNNRS